MSKNKNIFIIIWIILFLILIFILSKNYNKNDINNKVDIEKDTIDINVNTENSKVNINKNIEIPEDVLKDKYDINFKNEQYFWKVDIIENDFKPVLKKDLEQKLKEYFDENKNINLINLNITEKDYINLFSKYYSKDKKVDRPKINVEWYMTENSEKIQTFKWTIKAKWNFSMQSLKIWLSLNLKWELEKWFFKWKDKFAFRHLMYDVTWVNEKSYLDSYTSIYNNIFWHKPYHIKWKYYWLLINWKPYWYYLVLDNTKEDFLKNIDEVKNEQTCVIKSKSWSPKYRWDLTLRFWENRKHIMWDKDMNNIYDIEEWNNKYCLTEFRELLTKIEKKDYKWVEQNFNNINEIYLWQKYLLKTNNSTWIYQNFLLIKHNWKWNISLWDWDMALEKMNHPFSKEFLNDNWLINLILENKEKLNKEYVQKIDNFDYKKVIQENLKYNFNNHFNNIFLDRLIWFNYIKKEISNRNKIFHKYPLEKMNYESMKKYLEKDFWNIFNWNNYLNL
jgi:hypothetical protein